MYLQCIVNSSRLLGAHPDDSDKVENGKSLKYKERVTSGYVIGDGSLGETELNLEVLKWLDSNDARVMFSVEY